MQVLRRFWGIPAIEIWFNIPEDFSPRKQILCAYMNLDQPLNLSKHQRVLSQRNGQTLVTDLRLTPEELLALCAGNVRNEIRRAEKEGVTVNQYSSADLKINSKIIQDFCVEYDDLYKQKGLPHSSVSRHMQELCDGGVLTVSISQMEDRRMAYHVYVVGDNIARLLFSVSNFRDCEDNATRNAIGRANRFLHYQDMLYFQHMGCKIYDWGGYSSDPQLASINSFKAGFGGTQAPRYYANVTSHFLVMVGYRSVQALKGIRK